MKYYTLENKPQFENLQKVKVNFAMMGCLEIGILEGIIVGKTVENIIDHWLVQFDRIFPSYSYSVVAVPHPYIVNENE